MIMAKLKIFLLLISVSLNIAFLSAQQSQITITAPNSIVLSENTQASSNVQLLQIRADATNSFNLLRLICRPELSSFDACNTFLIFSLNQNYQSNAGYIYLAKKLNYLQQAQYTFWLSATNDQATANQTILITISRGYDRPPNFFGPMNTQIAERPTIINQDQIIQYTAKAGDPNVNYSINYRIIGGQNASYFSLDPITGRLTNARPLVYVDPVWQNGYLVITIEAALVIDGVAQWNNPDASTKALSTITLLDQDNFAPTFNQPEYVGYINERVVPSTVVDKIFVSVTDQDYTSANSRFRLYLDQYTDIFDISPNVGTKLVDARIVVINGSSFNYDYGQRTYSFKIMASETNSTLLKSSTATATVNIVQVNKYAPEFIPTSLYSVSIPEDLARSTQILRVQAIDKDVGDKYGNASIRYKFISGISNLIRLDYITGVISTSTCPTPGSSSCIDYERPETRFFQLVVAAVDQGGEGMSSLATVQINVTNVNDNKPLFTSNVYYGSITDGTTVLAMSPITANDADGDAVIYSIFSGNSANVWYLNPTTANFTANRPVSYNDTLPNNGFFLMYVNASDGMPSHTMQCIANITVTPVNRYPPVFSSAYYMTNISELATGGAVVYTMLATDADNPLTPGGKLQYRMGSGGNDKFEINPNSGVVTVRMGSTFNFQMMPQYNITIFANDLGTPAFQATTMLIVNITPYKSGPDFGVANFFGPDQKKTNPVGSYVMTISASDHDPNPRLMYYFISPFTAYDKNGVPLVPLTVADTGMFVINSNTGMVTIGQPLNYERIAKWQATVKCVDDNSPAKLSATAMFTINILPVNEMPPVFTLPWSTGSPSYNAILLESNNQLVFPIASYQAASPNASLQVTYSLTNNNAGYFRLNNSNSGSIYLSQLINFSEKSNMSVTLVATDNGEPPLSSYATVYFVFKRENLYSPVFNPMMYNATLSEDAPQNFRVIQVFATDRDPSNTDYGQITYSIKDTRFIIDPITGVISTARDSTVGRPPVSDFVILEVEASDCPANSAERKISETSAIVNIRIIDVNDFSPVFSPSYYAITILDNIAIGTPVITLTAVDADKGMNGMVQYSLRPSSGSNLFTINPNTGVVSTSTSLLNKLETYSLTVDATDSGTPTRSASAILSVTVRPSCLQSCVPTWHNPASLSTVINISEIAPTGYQLILLNATLISLFNQSRVNYSFYDFVKNGYTNIFENFMVNQSSGSLTLYKPLSYNVKRQYQLTVVAEDSNIKNSQVNSYITVNVLKGSPIFALFPNNNSCAYDYNLTVTSLTGNGSIIGVLQAKSNYIDDVITYRVVSTDDPSVLSVNSQTGQITYMKKFDKVIRMQVRATSVDSPTMSNLCSGTNYDASFVNVYVNYVVYMPTYSDVNPDICVDSLTDSGSEIYKFQTMLPPVVPVIYAEQSLVPTTLPKPFYMNQNGAILTLVSMQSVKNEKKFTMQATGMFNISDTSSVRLSPTIFIVNRTGLTLMTVNQPMQNLVPDRDNVLKNILDKIKSDAVVKKARVCIVDINTHFAGGVFNDQWTDIFMYVINENDVVIKPLELDALYAYNLREPTGVIGITGTVDTLPPVVYQGVAAAIGLIAGLLLLCLLFFCLCCCCIPMCLSFFGAKAKEPHIHRVESLGIVNRGVMPDMFEEEQQRISLPVGGNTIDKTIALHGQYDHEMMASLRGLEVHSDSLAGTAESIGGGTATPTGYVHIEAPLTMSKSDLGAYDGSANEERMTKTVTTHRSGTENMPYGGTYINENEFASGDNGVYSTSFSHRKTTDMTDGGRINQLYSVDEDPEHPVTLNPGGHRATRIGATLFRPQTPSGQAYTQSVISGAGPMDGFDSVARGYRGGDLAMQNEIVFSDYRPESMYVEEYENVVAQSGGTPYMGEIRMNTMGGGGGGGNVREVNYTEEYNETRYL